MERRFLIALAPALIAGFALAPVATADRGETVRVSTKVKLSYDASSLRGKLKVAKGDGSARRLCRTKRTVKVPGAGKAKTGEKGRFAIRLPELSPAGTYRAKVKRKTVRKGEKTVCGKGRSKKLTVTTLARPAEPVVLTGEDLPGIAGVAPNRVAGFSYLPGAKRWQQIPVQVDERHVADLQAVHNHTQPYGPLLALEYSYADTLTGADPDPNIDSDDEVVFMARDGFERAPAGAPEPAGARPGSGQEVRIADPLDSEAAAWVYLYGHDGSLDPAAGRDYVGYDFELLAGDYPGDYAFQGGPGDPVGDPPANPAPPANPEDSRVATAFYEERFADRWITDELRITAGGASGVDILDRNRLGAPFYDPAHPVPCPRSENTFAAGHGAFVANIDGPVRAIRDYIGANSGIYTQRRQVFYERREDLTTFLRVHPLPVGPSDLLDYNAAAIGMDYRNDLMAGAPAVKIDGVPDSVPTGSLTWELAQGGQGSLVVAHRLDTDIPDFQITSIYLDDSTPAVGQVPCTGEGQDLGQALGTSGTSIQNGVPRLDPTERGGSGPVYRLTAYRIHFYEPPGITAGTAQRRSDEARTPLVTGVAPRG